MADWISPCVVGMDPAGGDGLIQVAVLLLDEAVTVDAYRWEVKTPSPGATSQLVVFGADGGLFMSAAPEAADIAQMSERVFPAALIPAGMWFVGLAMHGNAKYRTSGGRLLTDATIKGPSPVAGYQSSLSGPGLPDVAGTVTPVAAVPRVNLRVR